MLFNLVVADPNAARLMALEDTLRPLIWGVRAAGHRVVAFSQRFEARPAVNIVVCAGSAEALHECLARAHREAGSDACAGLLIPDDEETPESRTLLRTLEAGSVRFLWTCASGTAPAAGPPAAALAFGFHPALLGSEALPDDRREVGAVLYGRETPYRAALAARLEAAVPQFLFVRPGHFPDYVVSDLLRRAALVVVSRADEQAGSAPQARIAKALCNGTAVVAEAGGDASPLAAYATACAAADIPQRCREALGKGDAGRGGAESLARFRGGPGMKHGVEAAVALAVRMAEA